MAYILYHGDCYDGFGAAWAIRKSLAVRPNPDSDVYLPCKYGQPMPEVPDGEEVIIVDFCYPEDQLRALATRSYFVSILDHHKSAQEELKDLMDPKNLPENMEVTFDMRRSGAMIAWKEFMGGEAPLLIKYIQDRDLWTKGLSFHEEVTAFIQSFERTFENFDTLDAILTTESGLMDAVEQGDAILRYKRQKVEEMCAQAVRVKIGDYENIPAVNCPYVFASDVGHRLLELHPEAPLAAYWFYRNDRVWQWGLRSRQTEEVDVSAIAKGYGGGGHKHAAGFEGGIGE